MYLWSLLGNDLMERPIQHGITDDVAKAMRAAEPYLKDGRAFVCVIEEVRLRLNVTGLDENYAATGKRWNGRRNRSDGVHWRVIAGTAGPARIYRVPESPYQGDLRGLVALMDAASMNTGCAFAEAGATTLYLQVLDLDDIDHMELIASEVLPQE